MSASSTLAAEAAELKRQSRAKQRQLKNQSKRDKRLAKRLSGFDDENVFKVLGMRKVFQAKAQALALAKCKAAPAPKRPAKSQRKARRW